jgi:trk system potassium uptake protein TrkH
LQVYLALTLVGFLGLWGCGQEPFVAFILSLSAVSTGGFSCFGDSLASLPLRAQLGVTLLSLAGAVSLPLYYLACKRRQIRELFDVEVCTLLIAVALLWLLILAMLFGGSTGSTAGGLKLIRLLILMRLIQLTLQPISAPPRAVLLPRLGRVRLEVDEIGDVLVLAGLWDC